MLCTSSASALFRRAALVRASYPMAAATKTPSTTSHPQGPTVRRGLRVAARPSDLVGNTPLLDLSTLLNEESRQRGTRLVGKMESLGPCSSVKDRLALSMINDAERRGLITPGKTVLIEPTSGNTGIALAFIARERGYRCILTMPETMSVERRMMLLALGAEVVLTPKEVAIRGSVAKAQELMQHIPDSYMLQQFENPANPQIHRETTGPEIWRDTEGAVDIFVSGVGTGGTVTGVSQYIKGSPEHNCPPLKQITTIAIEPQEQMILTEAKGGTKVGEQGPHKIQGMGAGFIPPVLDLNLVDEVVAVHSNTAMEMTHQLWMMGIPVGVSAGAIVSGAITVCERPQSAGQLAVAILPSFGERYFTHPMFAEVKQTAEGLQKQPLPEPFDNTQFGFDTPRG